MKIATWNVNSIRSRLERGLAWVDKQQPDVLCLQELKVVEDKFPFDEFREAGYHAEVLGQKTYNGVAILSRIPPDAVRRGFDDGDEEDPEARLIAARFGDVHVASIYVPNGRTVGSDKYEYKKAWLARLQRYLERHLSTSEQVALCGDFNIATDESEVARPDAWSTTVLFHPDMRQILESLKSWGLTDTFRMHHPDGGVYSWWDYRMLGFPKNDGLKIDHILATGPLAKRCTGAAVDRDERKGKKPSDHAPVLAEFAD